MAARARHVWRGLATALLIVLAPATALGQSGALTLPDNPDAAVGVWRGQRPPTPPPAPLEVFVGGP
ncbi:MAG: hypothetical protein AAF281_11090, partial [Pseudomonadota bacterium]